MDDSESTLKLCIRNCHKYIPSIIYAHVFLPIVCSAGVGRTGTFITIDHALQQAEKENMVNISGIINRIRQQRMKLVQTVVRLVYTPMIYYIIFVEAQIFLCVCVCVCVCVCAHFTTGSVCVCP